MVSGGVGSAMSRPVVGSGPDRVVCSYQEAVDTFARAGASEHHPARKRVSI